MGLALTISNTAVLDYARSQIGVHEDPPKSNRQPYGAWYGANGQAWCAMFVSACFARAGQALHITTDKGFAYCPYGVSYFKQIGAWAGPDVRPKPGWVVFFDFPNDGINRPSHTGLVEGVVRWDATDQIVATIEGNTNPAGGRTGGEVMRHNRTKRGGIIGYGIIDYAGAATTPTPTPAPTPTPQVSSERLRIGELQHLVGASADGVWGPNTEAACTRHMVCATKFHPKQHVGQRGVTNEPGCVRFVQGHANRKFNVGAATDGQVGPATNHIIVVLLGQADGVCGPNGYRQLTR